MYFQTKHKCRIRSSIWETKNSAIADRHTRFILYWCNLALIKVVLCKLVHLRKNKATWEKLVFISFMPCFVCDFILALFSSGIRYFWRCMLEDTERQVHKWKFLQHALSRYVYDCNWFDITEFLILILKVVRLIVTIVSISISINCY